MGECVGSGGWLVSGWIYGDIYGGVKDVWMNV